MISKLFSKEQAKRNLILLGISVGILLWFYVFAALMSKDWTWIKFDLSPLADPQERWEFVAESTFFVVLTAVVAVLIYWSAKKWMLNLLKRSGEAFLSAFLWGETIRNLNTADDTVEVEYYSDGTKEVHDGKMPLIFAIPVGIVLTLLRGFGLALVFFLGAVGLPLLSPALIAIGLAGIQALTSLYAVAVVIAGIIGVLVVVFFFIVQPVIALRKRK